MTSIQFTPFPNLYRPSSNDSCHDSRFEWKIPGRSPLTDSSHSVTPILPFRLFTADVKFESGQSPVVMGFAIFCHPGGHYSFALEAGILRHLSCSSRGYATDALHCSDVLSSLLSLAWRISRLWLLSIHAIKPALHP